MSAVIELTKARESLNPAKFFIDSSNVCEEMGITVQDVYGDFAETSETSWLKRFENEVANHLNKEDSLFMPSGGIAQSIALAHSKSNGSHFICHYTSHLLLHEQNAYSHLLNMTPLIVTGVVGQPLAYSDVAPLLDSPLKPSILLVELPHREIGGKCTSWDDLVLMSQHCKRNNVRFHCDGARLWEAEAGYNKPLDEICALFDSIYVSFYKGLGGVTGAMLLGDAEFIKESRLWLRRFGGNVFSLLPYAASCWSGYRQNKDSFFEKKQRLVEVVARLSALFVDSTEHSVPGLQGLLRFDPPVPQVSLVHLYLNASVGDVMAANEAAAQSTGVKCLTRMRPAAAVVSSDNDEPAASESCYTEFNMGPLNMQIPLEQWESGWTALLTELRRNATV